MPRITNCRSCASRNLSQVIDLGATPLANSLLRKDQLNQPEPVFNLAVGFCNNCSLAQLYESVPPEQLFSDYAYFSSFSDTMLSHSKLIVDQLIEKFKLQDNSLVVEVASNDGYLLQHYKSAGVPVLGIEPAQNVALVAQKKGIETITKFFCKTMAKDLAARGRKADVIHANNVLAHVPDLNGVVSGFRSLLKDTGVVVVEVPYVKDLLERIEFDTIYHEHLCYFSLTALDFLFSRNGLTIIDVEILEIHGGSLRIYATKGGEVCSSVKKLLEVEQDSGLTSFNAYANFARSVDNLKVELCTMLATLKGQGKRIAAYGAAAKGSTLLNYMGIDKQTIEFVCDRSTVKQGYYMPGVHLPIVSPAELIISQPDYVLLLTWNFANEIFEQQKSYRQLGGNFIVPIPHPDIVEFDPREPT
jgi:SAM-dependent methyltransferase